MSVYLRKCQILSFPSEARGRAKFRIALTERNPRNFSHDKFIVFALRETDLSTVVETDYANYLVINVPRAY